MSKTGDQPSGAEPEEGGLPVDRFGEVSSERARDRKGIIAFMARNGVAANLLMIAMIVAGLVSYSRISQEVFPEASLDTIAVSVVYPGATPEEVEEAIVQRIEEAVESVENVKKITSTASEGAGSVNIELEGGTDIARALDDVKSEVDQINTFPADAEEPNVRELTTRQGVMKIALFGDVPERTLKEAAYELEDAISGLDEVSYVQASAVRDYQIYADISQDQLRALNLSLTDVSNIVSASSLDSPAGSIDTATEEVRVRTVGQNYSQQDFENIILLTTGEGDIVRLGDVATIDDGFADNDLITRFNDKPVAFVDVFRTSDERVLDVAEAVRTLMEEDYQLPAGISYAVWDDDSILLNDRLSLLLKNAVIGLVLVLISLTLFLNLRLAFWTAIGIGATFTGAIFILEYAGSSINLFSLFGFILALGLVVDDAVVVGENIYAERERGRSGTGAAIAGAQRVTVPVIFAILTTIAAAVPLFATGGTIGKVISDIPLVLIAVLALSLVEALLILPYHLSHLPPPNHHGSNAVTLFFERVQAAVDARFKDFVNGPLDKALKFSVKLPAITLAGAVGVLVIMVAMLPAGIIKFAFFPPIEADQVTASLEMPAGTTIDRTAEMVDRIEDAGDRAVARFVEANDGDSSFLEATYTTIGLQQVQGGPDGNVDTFSPALANVQIALVTDDDRPLTAAELEEAWREELGEIPEARSLTISSSLLSFGDPVSIKVSHPNEDTLDQARLRVMQVLQPISGVFDIESDQDAGMREIELRLKPSARTLGVTLRDVASQVRAAFFGAEAVRVQRGQEDVRVYIRLPENERNSVADIESFRVRVPGGFTSVGAIAEASFTEAPSQINREGGRRVVTISADVNDDVITGQEVNQILQSELLPPILADYPGLRIDLGGEQEEQAETFGGLGPAFGIALIVIYALLAIPFKSYTQPLVIMAAIPFGMIGALFGHLLLGIPLGVLSIFGIVALSGVIINGSLVLIDFFNENVAQGMDADEAIIDAAKARFRPIMLTAITTFLGVAPITFETSQQAQFLIPMSASLGFGVLIGTALLMLVIPALTIVHTRSKARIKALFAGGTSSGEEMVGDDGDDRPVAAQSS